MSATPGSGAHILPRWSHAQLRHITHAEVQRWVTKPEHHYLTHGQVEDLANKCGYPTTPSRYLSSDVRECETYRLIVIFLATPVSGFGEMPASRIYRLDLNRQRAHRRVGHSSPGQSYGLGHAQDPRTPRRPTHPGLGLSPSVRPSR